jgi:hypothetical protein
MVFVDPDNGLEPPGYSDASSKAGESILISELREIARPARCLIVYHHHSRRKGGHHSEIKYWADRLRGIGLATVDALRAKPYSPRVFFLLDAPDDVRKRAEQIELKWAGRITWHPDRATGGDALPFAPSARQLTPISAVASPMFLDMASEPSAPLPPASEQSARRGRGASTQVGYGNGQKLNRTTRQPSTRLQLRHGDSYSGSRNKSQLPI